MKSIKQQRQGAFLSLPGSHGYICRHTHCPRAAQAGVLCPPRGCQGLLYQPWGQSRCTAWTWDRLFWGRCSEAWAIASSIPPTRVCSPESGGTPGFEDLAVELKINTSPGAHPQAAEDYFSLILFFFRCPRVALAFLPRLALRLPVEAIIHNHPIILLWATALRDKISHPLQRDCIPQSPL